MTPLIYVCAAVIVLLGVALVMIVVDLIRGLWR